jgi:acyl-CoA synthetase (AMP-forming)/AMP-acid ligase II
MILSSARRIQEYTDKGWWGTETLGDRFARTAASAPTTLALVDPPNRAEFTSGEPRRLTYAQLSAAVDGLAVRLLEQGIGRDDIVAAQLPNTVELVMVYLAAARIGAIVCPFPVQYREFELEQLVNFVGASTLLTTARIGKQFHAQMVAGLRAQLPTLTTVMAWGDDLPAGVVALDPLLATTPDRAILERHLAAGQSSANDIYTICWTSGTEGTPKGVPRSHNQWLAIGDAMMDAAELEPGCRILNPFPLVNMAGIGGMFVSWLLTGGTFVMHHPFSLPVFLKQLGDEHIDFTVAPPAVLNLLLQNEALLATADISGIKTLGSGSAPLSPWMVKTWQDQHQIAVVNFFGSNEGTTLVSGAKEIPDPEQRAQFFPRFGVEGIAWEARIASRMRTKLVDPHTGEAIDEPGQPGELLVSGSAIFDGYYRAPDLTASAFDGDGYFRTGDLFEIASTGDEPRFYRYAGRSKDIIIRGGQNISPEEIEGLLQGHPAVAEVAVVGYPDATLGERACACAVARPGQELTLAGLIAYLDERKIAVYKLPERLLVLEALPRNPVGKVLKTELRAQLAATVPATGAATSGADAPEVVDAPPASATAPVGPSGGRPMADKASPSAAPRRGLFARIFGRGGNSR